MLGLMYLGAITVYLAVMVIAIRWGWRAGRLNGRGRPWGVFGAVVGFLVVYLPVFWNHIPVALSHRAKCLEDGGFIALVEPRQWASRYRDSASLPPTLDLQKIVKAEDLPDGAKRDVYFGGLLASERRTTTTPFFGTTLTRIEQGVSDAATGVPLARNIEYQVGTPSDLRFWIAGHTCSSQGYAPKTWVMSERFHQAIQEALK